MSAQKTTSKLKPIQDEHTQVITDFIGIPRYIQAKCNKSNGNKVCDTKMKIYKEDGTYEERENDPSSCFGWMCSDFIVDENTPEFEIKNSCTRFSKTSRVKATHEICDSYSNLGSRDISARPLHEDETGSFQLQNTDFFYMNSRTPSSDSLVDLGGSTDSEEVIKKFYEVKPNVRMARIQSTQNTIEGPIGPDGKILKDRLGIDCEKPPSGEELAALLNPYSAKSRVLLSVLHNSKYQKVTQEMKDPAYFTSLIDHKDFRFLSSNEKGFEEIVLNEILDYQSSKDDNLSIMTEIILADMKCDIDDVVLKNKSVSDTELTDSGNASSFRFSSNSGHSGTNGQLTDEIDQSRSDLLRSLGLSDSFDRSLESYSEACQDFRTQLDLIKKSFQHQEGKTEQLTQNIRSLSKEMEEVNTLDDYLYLLEGNLDKVKYKIEAFKIFCHKTEMEENNFII